MGEGQGEGKLLFIKISNLLKNGLVQKKIQFKNKIYV